ncbi:MAG: Hsp20/alpha crystallin family protein [Treponema sp.]|nr:Hsp20/alpha crystallin family protein [Treponema sp.]
MNELSIFDTLFNNVFGNNSCYMNSNGYTPRVDIKEEKETYTLEMELPGRSADDVNIELNHDNLTISSKAEDKKEEKTDKKYILRERNSKNFERSFKLPEDVNPEAINAWFANGILTINLGKKEIMLPKKIEVKAC